MRVASAYFIPTKHFPVGQFKQRIIKALEKLSIVNGYYDEDEETFAAGDKIAFEYAAIHDSDKNKLVPESSSVGYGATCPSCKTDIDEDLYDTINDYYDFEIEKGKEMDMASLSLICPSCKTKTLLGKIIFTQPALLANQFFQFVDVDDEISAELLSQIESEIESRLRIIYERS